MLLVQVQQIETDLAMNLKFHASVAKGLKLKVRKFWRLMPSLVEVTGEKLKKDNFCPPHPD